MKPNNLSTFIKQADYQGGFVQQSFLEDISNLSTTQPPTTATATAATAVAVAVVQHEHSPQLPQQ